MRLTYQELQALAQAIGEVNAGEMETWSEAEQVALDRAHDKINAALHTREAKRLKRPASSVTPSEQKR